MNKKSKFAAVISNLIMFISGVIAITFMTIAFVDRFSIEKRTALFVAWVALALFLVTSVIKKAFIEKNPLKKYKGKWIQTYETKDGIKSVRIVEIKYDDEQKQYVYMCEEYDRNGKCTASWFADSLIFDKISEKIIYNGRVTLIDTKNKEENRIELKSSGEINFNTGRCENHDYHREVEKTILDITKWEDVHINEAKVEFNLKKINGYDINVATDKGTPKESLTNKQIAIDYYSYIFLNELSDKTTELEADMENEIKSSKLKHKRKRWKDITKHITQKYDGKISEMQEKLCKEEKEKAAYNYSQEILKKFYSTIVSDPELEKALKEEKSKKEKNLDNNKTTEKQNDNDKKTDEHPCNAICFVIQN